LAAPTSKPTRPYASHFGQKTRFDPPPFERERRGLREMHAAYPRH
jgi:hypothetical protein